MIYFASRPVLLQQICSPSVGGNEPTSILPANPTPIPIHLPSSTNVLMMPIVLSPPFCLSFLLLFLVFTPGRASRSEMAVNPIIPYLAKHCRCLTVCSQGIELKKLSPQVSFHPVRSCFVQEVFLSGIAFPLSFPSSIDRCSRLHPAFARFVFSYRREDKEEEV